MTEQSKHAVTMSVAALVCVLAGLALTPVAIAADADTTLAKAMEQYQDSKYRDALETFHAYSTEGQKAAQMEAYQTKCREQYGTDLGTVMAACRMMIECRVCKGEGGHDCKKCKGDGIVYRRKKKISTFVGTQGMSRKVIRWKEPRKCKTCAATGYRFCATCKGTGRSQIAPRKGRPLQLLDFERDDMAGLLEKEGEGYLRQMTLVRDDDGDDDRRDRRDRRRQRDGVTWKMGDPVDADAVDVNDMKLAARAGQFFEQATKISLSPRAKVSLQEKLRHTTRLRRTFTDMLEEEWKRQAEDNKAEALGLKKD